MYRQNYGEQMPVLQCVKKLAGIMQDYTQSGGVRPFGCSLLVTGTTPEGVKKLYQVDPSGAYYAWQATAIGRDHSVT
ncbi:proteasome, subunit alpha/beta, partial [Kipferlia bialata]|eukprot:g16481.t1